MANGSYHWRHVHALIVPLALAVVGSMAWGGADGGPAPDSTVDARGRTALHLAAARGDTKVMAALLDQGAVLEAPDDDGNTALHLAARVGWKKAVGLLLERGADASARTLCRYTPLHLAAWSGNAKVAGMLIARGADVHALDYDMITAIHYASTRKMVDALIAAGAEPSQRYAPWTRTPLLDAAMHGFPGAVEALLDHGVNIQQTNCIHFTPLHWAAWAGHTKVVKILMARGADVFYKDDRGRTALYWAEY